VSERSAGSCGRRQKRAVIGGGGGGGRHTKEGFGQAMQRTARAKNLKIAPK
jgi:hypothetical protein